VEARFTIRYTTITPFRLTAVFYRDGGEWRMVQAHFSLGVPNETFAEQR
jgi:hypothetical protein